MKFDFWILILINNLFFQDFLFVSGEVNVYRLH